MIPPQARTPGRQHGHLCTRDAGSQRLPFSDDAPRNRFLGSLGTLAQSPNQSPQLNPSLNPTYSTEHLPISTTMPDSPAVSDPADGISTRSCSNAPSTNDIRFSIVTPFIIETDLEAAKSRSRKRKADREAEANSPGKRLKSSEAPKNRGGRPRKDKPNTPKQPSGPLRLRKSKPVQAYVPPELWKLVLEHSSPALLLRAKNLNRNFYGLLTSGDQLSLWATARKATYGVDHPNPPAGISEIQYADLLEGQGCQGRGCKNNKTRKTYWGFLRRWCETCLETKIVSVSASSQAFSNIQANLTII